MVRAESFVLVERRLVVRRVLTTATHAVRSEHIVAEFFESNVLVAYKTLGLPTQLSATGHTFSPRVKTHPDGNIFFANDVDCEQYLTQIRVYVICPIFADEIKLSRYGCGRCKRWFAQHFE